ncbi:major facilitator superfamily transporter [Microdochium trichocladiopsis]|uniref:Major facilitator superfamily transporter n=1 Tax=Microdochium trichocladiopsis TaxID=1682393 RepID=A0A9P8YHE4_9PEZI|nr:major facilitator superfamily transporter [Microdochium trichocladiopsis]KAH7038190.1 major facilitator superfamily transporter [Microdochium trichocladiopsis]
MEAVSSSSSTSAALYRLLPFSPSTTPLQATTYLLGISLFSISFLVFLNSTVSFVITDRLGIKSGVGDIVGTLGFVDEIVALIACPAWGLLSDRLGVRWVAVLGYAIIGLALFCFVQARDVGGLVVVRILFAIGATAAATMVTAVLPVLTDDNAGAQEIRTGRRTNARHSLAMSTESDVTITQERFARSLSNIREEDDGIGGGKGKKPAALAGYVGLFTGCGALVALTLFLPLPAKFGEKEGVTPAEAVEYSYYVVGAIAFAVAVFVSYGFRKLRGEEEKGWRMLFGLRRQSTHDDDEQDIVGYPDRSTTAALEGTKYYPASKGPLPYRALLLSSLRLGVTDPHIALGYLGGFVARASTVAISLFIPLYINTYFMNHGFCQGSPHDPTPELKKECRAAYVLTAILTGVAQLVALLCAPLFGYLSSRRTSLKLGGGRWRVGVNVPVLVGALCGVVGYVIFPRMQSPEFKNIDERGGSPWIFLVVSLLGISQIAAIVCSLGSLGRGVLSADLPATIARETEDTAESSAARQVNPETQALLENGASSENDRQHMLVVSRVQLKGSIAGVYSWCGGAAILLLTKLGGYLFDVSSRGAPFYMMAAFNVVLFVVSLGVDVGRSFRNTEHERRVRL